MNQSACPKGFMKSVIMKSFTFEGKDLDQCWEKLQRRETFVDGQIFPYKVEFDNEVQYGSFKEGELNIHHGPLLSVHGVISKVTESYRGLNYFFGSYVISFRLIRPVKLEFFKREKAIEMQLVSYVKPWFKPFWKLGNDIFWKAFPRSMK
jgi:hypothetical protein